MVDGAIAHAQRHEPPCRAETKHLLFPITYKKAMMVRLQHSMTF